MTEPEPTIESLTELAETLHWVGTRALVDRNEAIARADKAEAELAERRERDDQSWQGDGRMITHEAVEAILGPTCSPEEAARRVAWGKAELARMSGKSDDKLAWETLMHEGKLARENAELHREVRRLRAMVLRMHASSVETNVFAGGWRAASLLRHYADGIESGRIP